MKLEKELLELGFKNEGVFYYKKGKMEVALCGSDFIDDIMTARYDKVKHTKIATIKDLQEFHKECTGDYIYNEIKTKSSKEDIEKVLKRGYLLD